MNPSTIDVRRCPETRAHYAHEWYTPLRVQCPGGPAETEPEPAERPRWVDLFGIDPDYTSDATITESETYVAERHAGGKWREVMTFRDYDRAAAYVRDNSPIFSPWRIVRVETATCRTVLDQQDPEDHPEDA